ncbi:MAG TPA: oxidoreductase [Rhodobacteraceae bacterium]|jgi:predicted dehydrogenase|nr:Gfo/Idh/MocA family oxidoreductase [Paracoccaceae bacterium]HBG98647.1 oxidoreductase [Paracoccaceae bacterium]
MTQPVRWGILGASGFARAEMAPAIHLAEGGLLAALATRDPARAAPFVACYPGLRIHESYDALLADPDIDAVYVPLPNDMHVPWTLRAAAAGKHVLCEKPIALRADDIDRLIAARDASGKLIAEGFMVVHHPQWARVRAMLADGAVGDLRRVDGAFTFCNGDRGNIRNIAERGGGALYDIGVYPTVTTRFATGAEPVAIAARAACEGGVDVLAEVRADFPGFTLQFHVGTRLAPRQEMVFHGTRGWLRLPAPFNAAVAGEAQIHWRRADGTDLVERFPTARHYVLQIAAFNRSVRTGAAYPCPLAFSRGNQAMLDRIFAAAGLRD